MELTVVFSVDVVCFCLRGRSQSKTNETIGFYNVEQSMFSTALTLLMQLLLVWCIQWIHNHLHIFNSISQQTRLLNLYIQSTWYPSVVVQSTIGFNSCIVWKTPCWTCRSIFYHLLSHYFVKAKVLCHDKNRTHFRHLFCGKSGIHQFRVDCKTLFFKCINLQLCAVFLLVLCTDLGFFIWIILMHVNKIYFQTIKSLLKRIKI